MKSLNYSQLKEAELSYLAKEKKKFPELFEKKTFFDNSDILRSIGISGVFPENLPLGYLKLWPQDFIVEEISKDGILQSVDDGPFFKKGAPFSESDLTIFATLVKCGLSTIEAREELAKILNLEKERISFAGIKDKDTISSQLISIRKGGIEALKQFNHPNFFLKNVYSGKGVVEIGSLKGNLFTIIVRTDKSFQKQIFLEQLEKIKKGGFWNFFYLQRFGTPRLISHLLGLLILKGHYEEVVHNFLAYSGNRELFYFQKLRENFEKNWGNWLEIEKPLKPFPIILRLEGRLVNYLKGHPKDFLGALKLIPDQIQLWVFAYASYLFNRKLSQLIKEGKETPTILPLILSKKKEDWEEYSQLLRADAIPLSFKPLKDFPFLQYTERNIKTKQTIELQKVEILPEGVIMSFSLPKACYATTFLAHFFKLSSGLPPKGILLNLIDTKATLGAGDLTNVLNRFQKVIRPKSEDILEKFE